MTTTHGEELVILAKVFITYNSKILLIRRSKTDPRRPLTWDLPGGLVESSEDPNTTVVREAMEEVGINLENPRIIKVHYKKEKSYKEPVLSLIYTAGVSNDKVTLSWEHDKYEWVTIEESQSYNMPDKYHEAIKSI